MKKILRNIALLLLPILAYYVLFAFFDPNNYFKVQPKATGSDITGALRNYEATPKNAIILGDSRMAKFDEDEIKSLTGQDYANLAYGGAILEEQLDILKWATEHNPELDTVVFGLSFYTLNKNYGTNRNVVASLYNPFIYLTNLGYHVNMLTNLLDHLNPNATVGAEGETQDPADYKNIAFTVPGTGETIQLREKLAEHLNGLYSVTQNWELDTQMLQTLLTDIDTYTQQGIRIIIVMPPMHASVMDYIVKEPSVDIYSQMQPVLQQLQNSSATLLDYEFSQTDLLDTDFYDGFHLDEKRGLPKWSAELFTTIAQEA